MTTTVPDDIVGDLQRLANPSCIAVLIEQLDVAQGLTRARHRAAFAFLARSAGAAPMGPRVSAELAFAPLLASRAAYVDHLLVLERAKA